MQFMFGNVFVGWSAEEKNDKSWRILVGIWPGVCCKVKKRGWKSQPYRSGSGKVLNFHCFEYCVCTSVFSSRQERPNPLFLLVFLCWWKWFYSIKEELCRYESGLMYLSASQWVCGRKSLWRAWNQRRLKKKYLQFAVSSRFRLIS